MPKFSDDDVRRIVDLRVNCGHYGTEIADMYNTDHSVINAIFRGETWHHVTGGGPFPISRKGLIKRFFRDHRVAVALGNECWTVGSNDGPKGYLRIHVKNRRVFAHRYSWEIHRGNVPNGLCVLHRCDNPRCVRPSHLFLGTRGDNNTDRARKGRSATGDRSGARKHPERIPRGDDHYMRKFPDKVRRGENANNAILTSKQVMNIVRRLKRGDVQSEIARDFGVSKYAINRIHKGRAWKHIPR